jgi:hypothetical protein
MPDSIAELLVTEAAIDKLGARGITTHDVRQVPRNNLADRHGLGLFAARA